MDQLYAHSSKFGYAPTEGKGGGFMLTVKEAWAWYHLPYD